MIKYEGTLTLGFEVDLDESVDYNTSRGERLILEAIYEYLDWDYFREARLTDVEVTEGDNNE
jgi:hypothetical protein